MNGGDDGGDGSWVQRRRSRLCGVRSRRQHTRRSVCARDVCEGKCAWRVCGGCALRVRRGRGREFEPCTCAPSKVDEVDDSKQRQEEHRSEERCPAHPRLECQPTTGAAGRPPQRLLGAAETVPKDVVGDTVAGSNARVEARRSWSEQLPVRRRASPVEKIARVDCGGDGAGLKKTRLWGGQLAIFSVILTVSC